MLYLKLLEEKKLRGKSLSQLMVGIMGGMVRMNFRLMRCQLVDVFLMECSKGRELSFGVLQRGTIVMFFFILWMVVMLDLLSPCLKNMV